jgi:hypothetical protein
METVGIIVLQIRQQFCGLQYHFYFIKIEFYSPSEPCVLAGTLDFGSELSA